MRAIQSERKSRRRTRRPREDCIIARSTASIARLYVPCRRPRKPFASFRTRFLRRRALNPRLTRIVSPRPPPGTSRRPAAGDVGAARVGPAPTYFGSPYGSALLRCFSSRRCKMSVLPSRFLRFRFLPRERLCRRFAFPALILPVPVMRKRFTALRFVFNFGILRVLPDTLRKSGALYTRRPEASSLRRLCPRGGHGSGLPHRSRRAGAGLPGRRRPGVGWAGGMGGRGRG